MNLIVAIQKSIRDLLGTKVPSMSDNRNRPYVLFQFIFTLILLLLLFVDISLHLVLLIDEMVKYYGWENIQSTKHLCEHWEISHIPLQQETYFLGTICQNCSSVVPVLFEEEKLLYDILH